MKVKPAIPGAVIRDPISRRALPEEGGDVPDTSFWIRRLRAGEVVIVGEREVTNLVTPESVTPLMTRGKE